MILFYKGFCSFLCCLGIRQLQVVLLKVALIMGVEIHYGVGYEGLEAPPEDQEHESKSRTYDTLGLHVMLLISFNAMNE